MFHKLFPGPSIPSGTALEKLKENLWLEKIAFIKQQLQKSSSNKVQTNETFPTQYPLPQVSPTVAVQKPAPKVMPPVFESSGVPLTSFPKASGISSIHIPENNKDNSYKASLQTDVTTATYQRFNSRVVSATNTETEFQTNNVNVPSIYSPKADASPLINWPGKSTGTATSPERGRSVTEKQIVNAGGLSVPLIPVPTADPKQATNNEISTTNEEIVQPVTPPEVMPPIEMPSSRETMQYNEPASDKKPITVQNNVVNKDSTGQNEIIFRPEPLPFTRADSPLSSPMISLPQTMTKENSLPDAVSSISNTLTGPMNDIAFPIKIQANGVSSVSLSQEPTAAEILPTLSQDKGGSSQTEIPTTQAPPQPSTVRNFNQEPVIPIQDQYLPSIPMLPGLIPQLPIPTDASPELKPGQVSYKTGDLFFQLPADNSQQSVSYIEANNSVVANTLLTSEATQFEADVKSADEVIAMSRTNQTAALPSDTMKPLDQPVDSTQQNKDYSQNSVSQPSADSAKIETYQQKTDSSQTVNQETVGNIQASINKQNVAKLQLTVTQQSMKSIPATSDRQNAENIWSSANQQNMEYSQTQINRQNNEYNTQAELNKQNSEPKQFGKNMNTVERTASMDLISLLFPGTQTPRIAEFTNEATNNPPNVMPDIVAGTQVPPDSSSITVTVQKGDNGNGCERVDDYNGK